MGSPIGVNVKNSIDLTGSKIIPTLKVKRLIWRALVRLPKHF
jgi:hypothetical protein